MVWWFSNRVEKMPHLYRQYSVTLYLCVILETSNNALQCGLLTIFWFFNNDITKSATDHIMFISAREQYSAHKHFGSNAAQWPYINSLTEGSSQYDLWRSGKEKKKLPTLTPLTYTELSVSTVYTDLVTYNPY